MDDAAALPAGEAKDVAAAEFGALLQREHSALFGYIHSLVRDFHDADDLFQQTALVLWRKFAEFDRSRSFLSWACGVARFEVSNFLRTRGRSRLYFSDELNLLLIDAQDRCRGDGDARRAALAGCMDRLREQDRQLVLDCYGENEARVAQIASQWGRSAQSVHNSLRRIRRALFSCVERKLSQAARLEVSP